MSLFKPILVVWPEPHVESVTYTDPMIPTRPEEIKIWYSAQKFGIKRRRSA